LSWHYLTNNPAICRIIHIWGIAGFFEPLPDYVSGLPDFVELPDFRTYLLAKRAVSFCAASKNLLLVMI